MQDSQAAVRLYMMHMVRWEEARLDGEQVATKNKAVERNSRWTEGKDGDDKVKKTAKQQNVKKNDELEEKKYDCRPEN